jgi:hypothetical protein
MNLLVGGLGKKEKGVLFFFPITDKGRISIKNA